MGEGFGVVHDEFEREPPCHQYSRKHRTGLALGWQRAWVYDPNVFLGR